MRVSIHRCAVAVAIACVLSACDSGAPPPAEPSEKDVKLVRQPDELTLFVGTTTTLDLSVYVRSRSNAPISYTLISPGEAADASLEGRILTLTGHHSGRSTVVVQAATQDILQFAIEVMVTGGSIEVVGAIPDTTLRAGVDTLRFDLTSVFRHRDNGPIGYRATSQRGVRTQIIGTSLWVSSTIVVRDTVFAVATTGSEPPVFVRFAVDARAP